jgi:hypothetical protein
MRRTKVNIQFKIFIDDVFYVVFSPELQLSGYGKIQKSVQKDFDQSVKLFIEELVKKGALLKALLELGWTLKRDSIKPPAISNIIFSEINIPTAQFLSIWDKEIVMPVFS